MFVNYVCSVHCSLLALLIIISLFPVRIFGNKSSENSIYYHHDQSIPNIDDNDEFDLVPELAQESKVYFIMVYILFDLFLFFLF